MTGTKTITLDSNKWETRPITRQCFICHNKEDKNSMIVDTSILYCCEECRKKIYELLYMTDEVSK